MYRLDVAYLQSESSSVVSLALHSSSLLFFPSFFLPPSLLFYSSFSPYFLLAFFPFFFLSLLLSCLTSLFFLPSFPFSLFLQNSPYFRTDQNSLTLFELTDCRQKPKVPKDLLCKLHVRPLLPERGQKSCLNLYV